LNFVSSVKVKPDRLSHINPLCAVQPRLRTVGLVCSWLDV
jgi:hypothetical protein